MAFAIMRCKKLKAAGSVAAAFSHCFRERKTFNADENQTHLNVHFAATSVAEAKQKLADLLPTKRRKDAVLAVEYVMSASPHWWKQASPERQDEFFQKSLAWLAQKYGQDRIVVATVHRDETSPHLSAFVVPLTRDGRLSARDFLGERGQLSEDQTTYAEAVQELSLERGVRGSKAKHQSVKAFYAALEKGSQGVPQLTSEDVKPKTRRRWLVFRSREPQEAVLERLNTKLRVEVEPVAQIAATARFECSRAAQMHDLALHQGKQLQTLKTALRGLGKDDIQAVIAHITELRAKRGAYETEKEASQGPESQGFQR